jgi:pyruvate ferredoxin oxidoreductase delta subunit
MKPISQPGTSKNNRTGSWRVFKPETDAPICIGCSRCAKVCPDGCIVMKQTAKGLKPKTNYNYCKGCGLCAKECPVKAIKMVKDF